jgi:hypothetical protein
MNEYFHLQGMNCSKKLRKYLDKTFYVINNPTEERYAMVSKNMDHDCPLHMANGYCLLQYECGENVLPSICRYYPRGPRFDLKYECSCSNSCEKVLELLFSNDESISFEETQLTFNLSNNTININEEKKAMYDKTRKICNIILTNREIFLPTRLILMGKVLQHIQKSMDEKQPIKFEKLIVEEMIKDLNITKNIDYALNIQERLLAFFAQHSPSIQFYASKALEYYHQGDHVEQYNLAKEHLKTLFPNLEIMFEKIIHNYLFYEQFPFSKQLETLWEEFESLCGVYLFTKYLAIGYMVDKNTLNDFIDVISAAFRLINHTSFNRNIDILLIDENITTLDQLANLINS